MSDVIRIARKEFQGFFASPTAFIFLGAFLAVTLFTFFWVERFFARNIADVRPLFEWMPLLLVFLVSAITMRMWSEERRAGTLELLLTAPVQPVQLVLGKFLACVGLVAVALLLTLPLPITVAWLGDLDGGPVVGGYVATLFLASAYIAIGLCVSARSDNAIVSLIVTAVLCGALYLIGSDALTGLFGTAGAALLELLGSGSRFESISRGVLDLRDLYYYLSLVGIFLALNVLFLESLRWAGNPSNAQHRRWGLLTGLLVANFAVANLWLAGVGFARVDLTEGNVYSISDATRGYLRQLREPLLIRGYFSAQTHPLLAPLVPRLQDLLEEYAQAGDGNVRVEFIDPLENPELEQEAGEKFGIRPVAFQTADKYQASVVNSYFDIVLQYGDEYETLGFRDLIDVKVASETDLDVQLRNPEYDITRALKKVLFAYQGSGDLFADITEPVQFKGYVSDTQRLPETLVNLRGELDAVLESLSTEAGEKLQVEFLDPGADPALAEELETAYGFRPMAASLFSPDTFWFYLTLQSGERIVQIPLPEDLTSRAELERSFEAALKRFSGGMLRTVALYTAPPPAPPGPHGGLPTGGSTFGWLRDGLGQEHGLETASLSDGRVPPEADILVLAEPRSLTEKQLFAVDQFLMQGGTVIVASSPYAVTASTKLSVDPQPSGLEDWLAHHGVRIEQELVLDEQSAALPIPVQRRLGSIVVQETRMVAFPYFVDVRADGLDEESGLTGGLQQVTMHWASPLAVDEEKNSERRVMRLIESSPRSWTSESVDLSPSGIRGAMDFTPPADTSRQLLAVAVEGRFDSYFEGKDSPLAAAEGEDANETDASAIARVIERSPESARLIVFGSSKFVSDDMLDLSSSGLGTQYLSPVQLLANAVDWSLEDQGLLAIRGRSQFSRTLPPLSQDAQMYWEYGNYAAAALGLLLLWLARQRVEQTQRQRYAAVLEAVGA